MCVYGRTIMCVNGRPCWRCPQGEQPNLSAQENSILRGKHMSALDQREHDTQIKLLAGIILCVFVAQCVCECVWINRWRQKKNVTFRELLNRPAGDARRQAPQVEGNGCGVNYLEWDWAFTGVGGSTRGWRGWCLGLMPRDKSHEAFVGGWALLLLPPFLFSFPFSWSAAGPALLTHCLSLIPTLSPCRSTCVSAAAGLDRYLFDSDTDAISNPALPAERHDWD